MERIDAQTAQAMSNAQLANSSLMKEGFKCDTLF